MFDVSTARDSMCLFAAPFGSLALPPLLLGHRAQKEGTTSEFGGIIVDLLGIAYGVSLGPCFCALGGSGCYSRDRGKYGFATATVRLIDLCGFPGCLLLAGCLVKSPATKWWRGIGKHAFSALQMFP